MANELDQAIIAHQHFDIGTVTKVDEIPFDFSRTRLSVIIKEAKSWKMITKGALNKILEICDRAEINGAQQPMEQQTLNTIHQHMADWSDQGFRVLGIAQKSVPPKKDYPIADEKNMIFMGFLLFFDSPRDAVTETLADLLISIETVDLFAKVDPNQKERIILALKKKNHVVGYMGDGINDALALHDIL